MSVCRSWLFKIFFKVLHNSHNEQQFNISVGNGGLAVKHQLSNSDSKLSKSSGVHTLTWHENRFTCLKEKCHSLKPFQIALFSRLGWF